MYSLKNFILFKIYYFNQLPSSEQDLKTHSKDAQRSELSTFNSSIGVLLSCLGCVIGTGNIWRFPRIIATASYSQGQLLFLVFYVDTFKYI